MGCTYAKGWEMSVDVVLWHVRMVALLACALVAGGVYDLQRWAACFGLWVLGAHLRHEADVMELRRGRCSAGLVEVLFVLFARVTYTLPVLPLVVAWWLA